MARRVSKKKKTDPRKSRSNGDHRIYISALRGARVVDKSGLALGVIRDVVIGVEEDGYPPVRGVVIRRSGVNRFVSSDAIIALQISGCRCEAQDYPAFEQKDGDILAFGNLLDRQIVDVAEIRINRVNDAVLGREDGRLCLIGIDVTFWGMLRRLGPQRLVRDLTAATVDWKNVEVLAAEMPEATLRLAHGKLAALHPSDLGRIVDRLPHKHGAELLTSLTSDMAADVFEEVQHERQPAILEHISAEKAIEILDKMAPDAAADVMEELPRGNADRLIKQMDPVAGADLQLLLSYPHDSAGGLMTTDFVIALARETTRETIERLRNEIRKPDLIYYVYVVDSPKSRKLRGVVSLRDLLLAKPGDPIASFMHTKTYSVLPDAHREEVARLMGEYNLLALPVIDEDGCMLGLVTVDDVLDIMLPDALRQHLPRLFS